MITIAQKQAYIVKAIGGAILPYEQFKHLKGTLTVGLNIRMGSKGR